MSDVLRELAIAKAVFQLRAIEGVIYAGAIADRNPTGGDVKQAPSLSDESSGGEANRTDNPVITPCNQTSD